MPDNLTVTQKIASVIGLDFTPAFQASRQLAEDLDRLNVKLSQLAGQAAQTSNILSAAMSQATGRVPKALYDQYGRELIRLEKDIAAQKFSVVRLSNKEVLDAEKEYWNQRTRLTELQQRRLIQLLERGQAEAAGTASRNPLLSQLQHRMGWFGSGLLFYGSLRGASDLIQAVGDVEMGMVQIQRVTEDATADFRAMRDELLALGREFGQGWDVVQDIALRWAQAGYGVRDTLTLTRAALMALNTAELDAEQSTRGMIAIMSQWELQAQDLLPTIDKINKVADDFAIESREIIDGLVRSSGAAKVMNLTLEQTIALLTIMREATGRTGKEVGNALNSILSFLQRPKAIKVFEAAGIKVFADEARTTYRNAMEILGELAARWTGLAPAVQDAFVAAAEDAGLYADEVQRLAEEMGVLTDAEKTELAQAGSGIYRRNFLIGLLERFTMVSKVLQTQEEATGYSMRENARTMETYQKKVESLRMAITELAVAAGEAGLLDVMKGLADGSAEALHVFRELPDPMRRVVLLLLELAGAVGMVNLGLRVFFDVSLASGIARVAASIGLIESASAGAGAALAALATQPVTWIIAALGAIALAIREYGRYQEELPGKLKAASDRYFEQARHLEDLAAQYDALTAKVNPTAKEQDQLRAVIEEIAKVAPQAVSGIDEMGRAVIRSGDAIRQEIENYRSLGRAALESLAAMAKARLPGLEQRREELGAQIGRLRAMYESGEIPGVGLEVLPPDRESLIPLWEGALKEAAKIQEEIQKYKNYIKEYEDFVRSGKPPVAAPAGKPPPSKKGRGGEPPEWIDAFRAGLEAQLAAMRPFREAVAGTEHELSLLGARQSVYNVLVEQSTDALVDYARAQEFAAQKLELLGQYQAQLSAESEVARAQVQALRREQEHVQKLYDQGKISLKDYRAATSEVTREIEQLTQQIRRNAEAWWEDERAKIQAAAETRNLRYEQVTAYIRHEANMHRLNTEEQIRLLTQLRETHQWNYRQMWELEEQIAELRSKALKEQAEKIEEAYRSELDALENRTKTTIRGLQDQIDALDEQKKLDDREQARREHEKKLADLQEKRRYHELRTGREHEKAIADIDKEIAEEQREWEEKQREWAREDQKESLQKQIDAVKDAAAEERRKLEEHYRKVQAIVKGGIFDSIAAMAATQPEWFETGKKLIDQLIEGLKSGDWTAVEEQLRTVRQAVAGAGETAAGQISGAIGGGFGVGEGQAPLAVVGPGSYRKVDGRTLMKARELAGLLGVEVAWDNDRRQVFLGGQWFTPDLLEEGTAWLGVRRVAEALGYRVDWQEPNVIIWPKAHEGARVITGGFAELAAGEEVLTPVMAWKFDRLLAALERVSFGSSGMPAVTERGILANFNGPLFHADKVELFDDLDAEILGREMGRGVKSVLGRVGA